MARSPLSPEVIKQRQENVNFFYWVDGYGISKAARLSKCSIKQANELLLSRDQFELHFYGKLQDHGNNRY